VDPAVRTQLVEQHMPLVRGLARRHVRYGEPYEDLVQVGAVGLVAAANRFDPDRGVPFAAYALSTVDGELRRHLRDRTSTVRVPRREQALAGALRRAAADAAQRLGHEAPLAEVAAAAGLPRREAELLLGGTGAVAPLTVLENEASRTAGEELEACERRLLLRTVLAELEPNERRALALRFAGELSLREVGRRLGMSEGRVARVIRRALDKIAAALDVDEP
jgi:RNA polymerase sigma-B factor